MEFSVGQHVHYFGATYIVKGVNTLNGNLYLENSAGTQVHTVTKKTIGSCKPQNVRKIKIGKK